MDKKLNYEKEKKSNTKVTHTKVNIGDKE